MSARVMFNVRFPAGVREAVKNSARRNRRSTTSEIIHLLTIEPSGPLPEGLEAVGARSGYQFGLRLPPDVHATLQDHARRSGRSMQGEVLYRIMSSLAQQGIEPAPATEDVAHATRAKSFTVTIRLTAEQRERLEAASSLGPYRVALTEIVTRGIELAAQELEAMEVARKGSAA